MSSGAMVFPDKSRVLPLPSVPLSTSHWKIFGDHDREKHDDAKLI
jgi:hypothetical protein